MADPQLQSSSSTLAVDKDLPDPEKSTLGLEDGDDIAQGSGSDVEKENGDVEKGPERPAPRIVLDWDGPDDPGNPHNWSARKKILHILPPAIISLSA